MEQTILEKLLEFIVQNFQIEKDEIDLEKSLIDEGVIDSFGLVEIAGFINNEYAFVIADEDIHRDNFGSVNKIVQFICRRVAS